MYPFRFEVIKQSVFKLKENAFYKIFIEIFDAFIYNRIGADKKSNAFNPKLPINTEDRRKFDMKVT